MKLLKWVLALILFVCIADTVLDLIFEHPIATLIIVILLLL